MTWKGVSSDSTLHFSLSRRVVGPIFHRPGTWRQARSAVTRPDSLLSGNQHAGIFLLLHLAPGDLTVDVIPFLHVQSADRRSQVEGSLHVDLGADRRTVDSGRWSQAPSEA